jgi:exonuclease VII small subunit
MIDSRAKLLLDEIEKNEHRLNDLDLNFIEDVIRWFDRGEELSEENHQRLEALYKKVSGG